jgi:hypothetical protein
MGRILPFWHDLSPAGWRDRAALYADESNRGRRPGAANPSTARVTDPYSGREVVVVPASTRMWPSCTCSARCGRQRPYLGHHRRAERSRLRRRTGDPDRRRDRRGRGDPLRPQPHPDPRVHRRCGLPCAILRPSLLHPGLLRPGQRLLPGVGRDQQDAEGCRLTWMNGCMG